MMDEISLEYLAGLVDADGHLGINKAKPSLAYRTVNPTYKTTLSVSNVYFPIIEQLREQFGGSITTMKARSDKHRVCYQWILQSRSLEPLLSELIGHLRIKNRQAGLLLALGTWHQPNDERGLVDDDIIMMKETIYLKCKELNSGGG